MEKKNVSVFKILMTILFTVIVFGSFFMCIFFDKLPAEWNLKPNYFSYGCICASALFALIFIEACPRKILVPLALAVNVASDYFLVFSDYNAGNNKIIGLSLFLMVQFIYMIYTFFVSGSKVGIIINVALRVAAILTICLIVPKYVALDTVEIMALVYIANSAVTLLSLLIHIKSQWLMFIGFLLFILCDIVVGLKEGGFEVLNITGKFVEFLNAHDYAFYLYVPGIFLISASSVWGKREWRKEK